MVGAVFLELYAAKEMDIGGMGVEIGQGEGYLRLGDSLIFLGIVDEAFLNKVPLPPHQRVQRQSLKKPIGNEGVGIAPRTPTKVCWPLISALTSSQRMAA